MATTNKTTSTKGPKYIESVGRRREATVRVRLYPLNGKSEVAVEGKQLKKGEIIVNDKPATDYFQGPRSAALYTAPLKVAGVDGVAIAMLASGGGKNGQLEAAVHALSRAVDMLNPEAHHSALKKRGFLTRDPRKKERRKAGLAGRARAKKSSPKR